MSGMITNNMVKIATTKTTFYEIKLRLDKDQINQAIISYVAHKPLQDECDLLLFQKYICIFPN